MMTNNMNCAENLTAKSLGNCNMKRFEIQPGLRHTQTPLQGLTIKEKKYYQEDRIVTDHVVKQVFTSRM